jgi:hypothetical protein
LVKGKPWDINELRQLRKLVDEGKGFDELSKIMVKSDDSIRQKVFDLGLKVVSLKEKKIDENKNNRVFFLLLSLFCLRSCLVLKLRLRLWRLLWRGFRSLGWINVMFFGCGALLRVLRCKRNFYRIT